MQRLLPKRCKCLPFPPDARSRAIRVSSPLIFRLWPAAAPRVDPASSVWPADARGLRPPPGEDP